jgi:uncharacterized membrane protein YphA (DoxX/SURF4 family)
MNLAARILLRWAWVGLFLWFGTQQLLHPAAWVGLLPEWTGYMPIPGEMLIQLNGWLEVCLAIALLLGCYTRFAAAVLAVHLFGIAISVGGATGVRDATLSMMGISLVLGEPDTWTLDARFRKQTY